MGRVPVDFDPDTPRIHPDPVEIDPADEESVDVWGFRDTAFRARADGVVVALNGRLAAGETRALLADCEPRIWIASTRSRGLGACDAWQAKPVLFFPIQNSFDIFQIYEDHQRARQSLPSQI